MEITMRRLVFAGIFLFTLLFSFNKTADAAKVNGFNFKPGDILITKSTSPGISGSGFAGHAAIVLPDGKNFISIAGYGHKPQKHSISWWLNTKKYKTKVVRANSSSQAKKAANYAEKYFVKGKYKGLPYGFKNTITGHKQLYCSKIVWQSYYFGAEKNFKVYGNMGGGLVIAYGWATPEIIAPYSYISSRNLKYNGFKIVKSLKWS